jgi:uncharacterized protein DUF6152
VEVLAMNSRFWRIFALPFCLFVGVAPVMAHHAFAGQFDVNKPITLMGTVTKIEWMNPHIYFYIDVKDSDGKVANWMIEGGSPNGLMRAGWTRNSLKPGMEVNVEGYLAKDGSKIANMTTVTAAGKKVLGRIESPGDPAK